MASGVNGRSRPTAIQLALITLGFLSLAGLDFGATYLRPRVSFGRTELVLLAGGGASLAAGMLTIGFIYRRRLAGAVDGLVRIASPLVGQGHRRWAVLSGLTLLAYPVAVLGPWGVYLVAPVQRLFVFWCLSLLLMVWLRAYRPGRTLAGSLAASILVLGTVALLSTYIPQVSNDRFSLGWSEASRYYYASLFLAQRIYGTWAPTSILHPTRYLLQAIPFLVPGSPIWLHRLWQVVLWIVVTYGAAYLLARRLELGEPSRRKWIVLWLALFLLQGPVYYHLLASVLLVLALYHPGRFWQTLIGVILASAWAGASRVNWVPVPAMVAIALFTLERERGALGFAAYWWRPSLWAIVGVAAGFAGQAGYINLSGNDPSAFGTAFSSPLLWYRLLPNPTYPLGVLAAILLATGPAGWLIARSLRAGWSPARSLRVAANLGMLAILLAGGLVVSVKIGGGSNLHNFDALFVLLAICGLYWTFDRRWRPTGGAPSSWWLTAAAALMPMVFLLQLGGPISWRSPAMEDAALSAIRQAADKSVAEGRPVLFISERQLLTFGQVRGVGLVPGFEKVTLMEMAMADNQPYLDRFWQAVTSRNYGLIVSEPLTENYQGSSHAFGEENDAWVKRVSVPVLCYYRSIYTSKDPPVELLVPRTGPTSCQSSEWSTP